jgi:hypothetical protein
VSTQEDSKKPEARAAALHEAEVDEAIATCGGDVRAALRATLIANAYLEAEIERLTEAVSSGVTQKLSVWGRGSQHARGLWSPNVPERRTGRPVTRTAARPACLGEFDSYDITRYMQSNITRRVNLSDKDRRRRVAMS